MAEKLFPARVRCKSCGKGLGLGANDPVLLGLYCSPRCAKMANPATRVQDAPRECTTVREGAPVFKRRYRSESEVSDKIRDDVSTSLYWCNHCGHLHVGHSRVVAESQRVVHAPEDLREVLIKRRGQAKIADVARAAGVRPIRLKELETGVAHPEGLATLFKVARVLKLELSVGFKNLR